MARQGLLIIALRLFRVSGVTLAFSASLKALMGCCCRGPSALDHLAARLTVSMMTLADVASATLPEGVTDAAASAGSAVQSATDAAASTITQKDNGWFGFLTGPLETVLKVCLPAPGTVQFVQSAMSGQDGSFPAWCCRFVETRGGNTAVQGLVIVHSSPVRYLCCLRA